MPTIKSATVTVSHGSKYRRGKKRLTRAEAIRAIYAGANLRAFNINGRPVDGMCSCRDFEDGAVIELREGDDCLACFVFGKHLLTTA